MNNSRQNLKSDLIYLAAECHRRKWVYSEEDQTVNHPFDTLHNLGNYILDIEKRLD